MRITQGDYSHIQCRKGCHQKRYDAVKLFEQMNQARKDCKIPTYMVPKCPVCGGAMHMNLRSNQYFVQDEEWYVAEKRFGDFMTEALESEKKSVCLKLAWDLTRLPLSVFRLKSWQRSIKKHRLCA
jgi:NAD-dependent SIR2 family protein deacetylase